MAVVCRRSTSVPPAIHISRVTKLIELLDVHRPLGWFEPYPCASGAPQSSKMNFIETPSPKPAAKCWLQWAVKPCVFVDADSCGSWYRWWWSRKIITCKQDRLSIQLQTPEVLDTVHPSYQRLQGHDVWKHDGSGWSQLTCRLVREQRGQRRFDSVWDRSCTVRPS